MNTEGACAHTRTRERTRTNTPFPFYPRCFSVSINFSFLFFLSTHSLFFSFFFLVFVSSSVSVCFVFVLFHYVYSCLASILHEFSFSSLSSNRNASYPIRKKIFKYAVFYFASLMIFENGNMQTRKENGECIPERIRADKPRQ